MKQKLLTRVITLAVILAPLSCGKDKKTAQTGDGINGPRGVVQGQIINGVTFEPIDLWAASKKGSRIEIEVGGALYGAMIRGVDTNSKSSQVIRKGEYFFTDIPVGQSLPLVAHIDGFQAFRGMISVESRTNCGNIGAVRSGQGTDEVDKESRCTPAELDMYFEQTPIQQANIYLYPVGGDQVENLQVFVEKEGSPVVNAAVRLVPTNTNELNPQKLDATRKELGMSPHVDQDFFVIPTIRQPVQEATTDDQGEVTFDSQELTLGNKYKVMVINRTGSFSEQLYSKNITIGTSPSNEFSLVNSSFKFVFSLTQGDEELKAQFVSNKTQYHNEKGELKFIFNREIEIVPGTIDEITATLINAVDAELLENYKNNGVSETVDVRVSGNTLTLIPNFVEGKAGDAAVEPGLKVAFSGIKLRPKNLPIADKLAIDLKDISYVREAPISLEVSIFGGEATAVAKELNIAKKDFVIGTANASEPLDIRLLDFNGQPYQDGKVTLEVTLGTGAIQIAYVDESNKNQTLTVNKGETVDLYSDETGKLSLLAAGKVNNPKRIENVTMTWKYGGEDIQKIEVRPEDSRVAWGLLSATR